ncbi:Indole-3-acetic acid-amido synthetase GH3.17 [Cardamine amara subsp. amara]|uniref:Indole-3-acetic acid-amido synthetase GH3.17 n=1 Tax=Cardamine amara subsp. amara TaxID=228776 RepID=A0ABD1A3X0_CARAN
MVISIQLEATTEDNILRALTQASRVLESSNLLLMGSTSWPDVSTVPGHYVMYWELKSKNINGLVELDDNKVLVECCCVVEQSLNLLYRNNRTKLRSIGALEIRVVQQGTFDSLMEFFMSQGASASQYKTPSCINSVEALAVLESRVLTRFFSDKNPTSEL